MKGTVSELHRESIVVIGHDHTMISVMARREQGERAVFSNYIAPLIQEGGVNVLGLVVGGDRPRPEKGGCHPWRDSLDLIDTLRQEEKESNDAFSICLNERDIDQAIVEGKLAVLLVMEGGKPIVDESGMEPLTALKTLYQLGVRSVQLLGSGWNAMIETTPDAKISQGLSQFGKDVVFEMNHLGMVVDLAHVSDDDPLFWDIIETCEKPLIASHHSVKTVSGIPGALGDEGIKAIADKRGVVGITFASNQMNPAVEQASVSDLILHIEHVTEIVGVDCVGLGPDFGDLSYLGLNSQSYYVEDVHDLSRIPRVTDALLKTGYSDLDVRKILGQNLLRVFRQVI